jgi:hypothetical protein
MFRLPGLLSSLPRGQKRQVREKSEGNYRPGLTGEIILAQGPTEKKRKKKR